MSDVADDSTGVYLKETGQKRKSYCSSTYPYFFLSSSNCVCVVENFVCTGVIVKYEKCTRNRFKDRDYGWSRLDVADKGR